MFFFGFWSNMERWPFYNDYVSVRVGTNIQNSVETRFVYILDLRPFLLLVLNMVNMKYKHFNPRISSFSSRCTPIYEITSKIIPLAVTVIKISPHTNLIGIGAPARATTHCRCQGGHFPADDEDSVARWRHFSRSAAQLSNEAQINRTKRENPF